MTRGDWWRFTALVSSTLVTVGVIGLVAVVLIRAAS
jgi:hypothetical protein